MTYTKFDCIDGFNEIRQTLGDNYDTLNNDYKGYLEELENASKEFIVWRYSLDITAVSDDAMKQIIGANGCYFIMTTKNCGLDFLWHNREKQTIEFWGPKANIEQAKSVINNRIQRHTTPI